MHLNLFIMEKRGFTYLLSLLFAISFLACSDDDDNGNDNGMPDPDMGRFEMSVSGDASHEIEGLAFFVTAVNPDTGQEITSLTLVKEGEPASVTMLTIGGSRPSSGTYTIEDYLLFDVDEDFQYPDDVFLGMGYHSYNASVLYFYSKAGQLTINHSSLVNVSGSFSFSADGFQSDPPMVDGDLEISGVFNAIVTDTPPAHP